ncbi:sensor domain-containing protein [Streptomyces sp. NPDC051130]|uniref:sensor domain-containing protein n=1 Tax=Streptomyces sp. NPDC051130 TaxID=3157223 RepID=UPI0034242BE6
MIRLAPSRLRPPDALARLPLSAATWLAVAYLVSYPIVGGVLFAVATAALLGAVVAGQLTVTVPLIIGAAWVIRGCAQVERGRAYLIDRPIPYLYRDVGESGLTAHIKARCTDPAIVRDCAYLVLLFPPLLLLDALALIAWLVPLGCLTLPLWYGNANVSGTIPLTGTLPGALAVAVVALGLLPFAARLVVFAAQLHLTIARAVLRPPGDPLAHAKQVLARPGPLAVPRRAPDAGTSIEPTPDREAHEPNTGRVG